MTRTTLLSAALLGLFGASAAQADGVVPGSDTGARQFQAGQDLAVATGANAAPDATVLERDRTFGYRPDGRSGGRVPGSEFFADAASDRAAAGVATGQGERSLTDAPAIDARLVPGSGSF